MWQVDTANRGILRQRKSNATLSAVVAGSSPAASLWLTTDEKGSSDGVQEEARALGIEVMEVDA